jgi:hypothetical protein
VGWWRGFEVAIGIHARALLALTEQTARGFHSLTPSTLVLNFPLISFARNHRKGMLAWTWRRRMWWRLFTKRKKC